MADANVPPAGETTETGAGTAPPSGTGQEAPPSKPGGSTIWLILILWVVVLYFFFMRPQRRKEKDRKAMIGNVKKGDRIVTVGGIYGKVTALDAETVTVRTDEKSGTTLKLQRAAINAVVSDQDRDPAQEGA